MDNESLKDRFFAVLTRLIRSRQKFILICAIALTVIIIALVFLSGPKEKAEIPVHSTILVIPADELFIPGEPDFLPDFLLMRNPKPVWTEGDVLPFWIDLEYGRREFWIDEMSSVIDRLMETVQ